MKLILLFFLTLYPFILNQSCRISRTKDKSISSFNDCKSYTTSSEDKICCYVNGQDNKFQDISACEEFTGTEQGAYKDLYSLEGLTSFRFYYLEADCGWKKKIQRCDPDNLKSNTPLSTDFCKQFYYVGVTGIDEDMNCCYVTGKNLKNENVYSCVGVDTYFYTESERKKQIESREFERLGALTDIKITCEKESGSYFLFPFLSLLFALYCLII